MRRLLIGASIATILTSLICLALTPSHPGDLPRHFQSPIVAAELVRNAAEIEQVYGTAAQAGRCGARQDDAAPPWDCAFSATMRWNTGVDFLAIASYALTFFLLGRLLPNRLGWLVMILAPIAALGDIVENIGILRATSETATDALALAIRGPALVKWSALSLIWLSYVVLFWGRFRSSGASLSWRVAEFATGLLYGAAGALCLVGLLGNESLLEPGVLAVGMAILLQVSVLWRDRDMPRDYRLEAMSAERS